MKIGIDIRSTLKRRRTGVGQYTYNLIKNLAFIDNSNQYFLYAKKRLFSQDKKLPNIKVKNFQFKIDRFNKGLNRILGRVDIFHTPSQDLLDIAGVKIIVTVHDLIFKTYPQGHCENTIKNAESQLLNVISRADKIICYSQSTISDLKNYYNVDDNKIKLIYPGVDKEVFYPMQSWETKKTQKKLKKFGINGKFILFTGTIEPRKNIGNLILAFDNLKKQYHFPHKLVIIGMKGWLYEKIFSLYKQSEFKADIIFLDYQPNNTLRDFYNLADVFVYPSFYEGFGFPILEAFSCGTAVVTSNVSSCKEVAEGAALLVNPDNIDEITEAISKIIKDKELKNQLSNAGLEQSLMFSWQSTARETLEAYEEVLNQ
ncbi:MAG: glycosyltransferase family 4 protein [Candidatus Omnitrophica bacterium]|nr:glycosyltransferase family 4 protein [Candidatus Omnitrophota bacterium]